MSNILTNMLIDCMWENDISLMQENHCIGLCGALHSVISHLIATFTTKTTIQKIITYGIWNVCPKNSTLGCLNQIQKGLAIKRGNLQRIGTVRRKEENGIVTILEEQLIGLNGKEKREIALFVENLLKLLLEKMNKNFVTKIAGPLIIEDVKELKETADVWDITVSEQGHFSLSNGAIVHNSDAMRYLCISLPKTRDGSSPEDLERRYQEAVLGENRNMPSVFRTDIDNY